MLKRLTGLLLITLTVWAQYDHTPDTGGASVKLLDENRFQWHTSYTLQVMALQGRMLSMGTITGNWSYRYSPDLTIQGQVGLAQPGFSSSFPGITPNRPQLWWRGRIVYRPRPGMSLLVELGQYPAYPILPSYSRWGISKYPYSSAK